MSKLEKAPLIGIISCQKELENYKIQSVNEFYLDAIRAFGGLPVVFMAGSSHQEVKQLLSIVDGVLLPGSHSNVAPEHYGATHHELKKDTGRDQLSFSIIKQCAEKKIPILGICRGFQEMNVALGGSLHPEVHSIEGNLDHRELETPDFSVTYAPAHAVNLSQGGVFQQWLEGQKFIRVNSLHSQGVKQLAPSLIIEATAPDGLIEAFSLEKHPYFIGVQWHPEWQPTEEFFSKILFKQFILSALLRR